MAARKSLQELALTSKKYSYRNSPDYSNTSTSITEWRRNPAWLPMPGFNYTIDNTFGDASAFSVFTGIKQSDDKLIFGGAFNSIGSTGSKYIGRINSNGSYDSSFNVGTGFNAFVRTLALQSDGKVLVGGQFSSYDGTTANGIIRLNSTGSVDTSFNIGTGFDDEVYRITIQPDNKILVGGFFTSYNGTTVNKLVRLNTDGSLDTSFSTTRTGSGFSGAITSILVTPDRILVGGSFNSFDGSGARTYFLGLKNDGSYDTTYNSSNAGPNGTVRNIAQQTNGKIIITGSFSTWTTTGANTVIAGGIARINTDGSIDTSFRTGSGDPSSTGQSVTVSSDDYIYFGGFFTTFNGYTSKRLARLNPDGSFDTSFNIGTGADNTVYGTIIESTGKPIVYGAFTSFQGTGYGLIRLAATEEKISILKSVHANSDFTTLQFEGNYTINWGDGNTENLAANTLAFHQYDYANTNLANTNGPVTFTDTGDLVTRTAHGYANTDIVTFYTISNTTGITVDTPYYVANSTANTFQLSNTSNGSIVSLTTDGTGTLLPYKQVLITITPQAGANLTNVILNTANTTALTSGFESNFLDISASVPNVTNKIGVGTFSVGSTTQATKMNRLERVSFHNTANVTSMNNMFYNCSSLQSVPLFDTAKVTNMDTMFNNCYSLQSVPLFNTANVNTMSTMFYYCYSLQSVPLFNTANVTSMNNMFYYCSSLKSVPLFNTANVTTMSSMFSSCSSLQSVPLFNTAKVTSMGSMFYYCYSLQSVPLFNTAKVTDMNNMFNNCPSLKSVPLFNTANVTSMGSMFQGCTSLQSVPLFNTAKVTSMSYMFQSCPSLQSVPLFNTANVTDMGSMFSSCYSLQSVPLFNTANVTSMGNMFQYCYSLQSVPLFNTANVNTMSTMFYYCYSLQSVPLFNTANVTSMNNMFQNCTSLQSVPLFDTAKVTSMNNMFQGCTSLQSVPLFNTANVTNMSGMFYFSYSLQSVPLFDTAKVTNMSFMFVSCNSLQSVPLFNTANVTNMDSMIYSCLSLQSVPLFDTAKVTNMSFMFGSCPSLQSVPLFNTANVTSMFAMFSGCYSLKSVPAFNANSVTNFAAMFGSARLTRSQLANTKYSISYADQNLSGNSLNEIYTNLPTVTAQTITVTGNWGTATDDPTIATAKGWTVTG